MKNANWIGPNPSDQLTVTAKLLDRPGVTVNVGPDRTTIAYSDDKAAAEIEVDSTMWHGWIKAGWIDPVTNRITDIGRANVAVA